MKKNIVFLCYSGYVVMNAYFIKRLYYNDCRCTLIVSDELRDSEQMIKRIQDLLIWDEVLCIREKNNNPENIYAQINEYLKKHRVDIFYVANILRCASHYFVRSLSQEVEINMFDEGIISLDIIEGYRYYGNDGLKFGWYDFDFDKIFKFLVMFPKITTPFAKVSIMGIEIERIIKDKDSLNDLNRIFGYEKTSDTKQPSYIVIDSNMAQQGFISESYENFCARHLIEILGKEKCQIKIKPSDKLELLEEKYKISRIYFLSNGTIPFEIIYLNMILENRVPEYIVAFPTTLIWNIALINEKLNISGVKIVSLAGIIAQLFNDTVEADKLMDKMHRYQSSLSGTGEISIPMCWKEFNEIMFLESEEEDKEKEWLIQEYRNIITKRNEEKTSLNRKNKILRDFLDKDKLMITFKNYFAEKKVKDIIIFGNGEFANIIYPVLRTVGVIVKYVFKSEVQKNEKFYDLPVNPIHIFIEKNNENLPIIITAVGKEKEVIKLFTQHKITNSLIILDDIFR